MQKLGLNFSLNQKLSPQQIQFIKLLQVTTGELSSRIQEEMEINPALEEGMEIADNNNEKDEYDSDNNNDDDSDFDDDNSGEKDNKDDNTDDYADEKISDERATDESNDINLDDYLGDDIPGYKMQGDGYNADDDDRERPMGTGTSLAENLLVQLSYIPLSETQQKIGEQLIGSIDADGYIRRPLTSIADDLAFKQNINVEDDDVEEVLSMIQQFDPAGIAARNLQECLLLQLDRRSDNYEVASLAIRVIEDCFEEFTRKHYDKIMRRLDLEDIEELKAAIKMITHLNPKPGEANGTEAKSQYVIPDFVVTENNGELEISLDGRNEPQLRVSRQYTELFDTYDKSDKKNKSIRETVTFVKQKLDAARWFIDAIRQRQQTLLFTMHAIAEKQRDFLLEGDEAKLKPMILKDIAEVIGMDISTVSRVVNSKYVQTDFGVFPLKYFFSEGIATDSGEDVSSREVKQILRTFIEAEDKRKPLSDEKLEELLNQKGYEIARRTVAKYREQLNIPVARLRKEM